MTDRGTNGQTDDGLCEQLYSAKSYIINQILKNNLLAKILLKKNSGKLWFLSLSRSFIFPLSVNGCKFDI